MPLITWRTIEDKDRPVGAEASDRFDTPIDRTLAQLDREAAHIGATAVTVHVDIPPRAFSTRLSRPRLDVPAYTPGVVVDIEAAIGTLRYQTAAYDNWQANLRAVVLALEALRAVNRHGVVSGEQYVGNLLALEAGPTAAGPPALDELTVDSAARLLAEQSGFPRYTDGEGWRKLLETDGDVTLAWRQAMKRAHPDVGGDPDTFSRLGRARRVLRDYHGTVD